MALQALKESKLPTSICRLSPPSSPSRKASLSTSRSTLKSKLLDTLDSQPSTWLAAPTIPPLQSAISLLQENTRSNVLEGAKPLHPFFLAAGFSQTAVQPATKTKSSTNPNVAERHPAAPKEHDNAILPLYSYKKYEPAPVIVYTRHEEEADELVQTLQGPLGFDLEWRVFFRRNATPSERRTALVQLSDKRTILLVHVSAMKKFPLKVKAVIESPKVVKTGANIRNDGEKLFRDFGIVASNLVELGALAQKADPAFSLVYRRSIVSLARMVEMYAEKTLDKGKVRTGDWEANPLSQEQMTYAANDAHCALIVYNRLFAIAAEREIGLSSATYTCDLAAVHAAQQAATKAASTASPVAEDAVAGASIAPSASATVTSSKTVPSSSMTTVSKPPSVRPSAHTTSAHQPPRPQHLRAYNLWHHKNSSLPDICAALRSKENPLAKSTVISYVVWALQSDTALPFSVERLEALARLEQGSWTRHRDWITTAQSRS